MKRRLTAALLLLTFVISIPVAAFAAEYVANKRSGKFHYVDCRWGQKIASYNRVYYDDRDDAIEDGYVPCKVCRP